VDQAAGAEHLLQLGHLGLREHRHQGHLDAGAGDVTEQGLGLYLISLYLKQHREVLQTNTSVETWLIEKPARIYLQELQVGPELVERLGDGLPVRGPLGVTWC
jgi:hypothetical protein